MDSMALFGNRFSSPLFGLSREMVSILSVSVSFMFLFGSVNTMHNMQKVLVNSMENDLADFSADGYTVAAVTYGSFALFLWIGPCVTHSIGAKRAMVIASGGYLLMVTSLAAGRAWVLYAGAAVGGLSSGALWPAHGHYVIRNSSPQTTSSNFAIFQFICMSSTAVGNLLVYIKLDGKTYIDHGTRSQIIQCFVVICAISVLSFLCIPKLRRNQDDDHVSPLKTFKKTIVLLTYRRMPWLAFVFCYAGMQQAFYSGIYSPSIGFTLEFGDNTKQLVPLSGIFMSLGSLLGALLSMALSQRRLPVVVCGIAAQLVAFAITFVNLPDSAVFGDTTQQSLFKPSTQLAMIGSVMLGFGDSCLVIQTYSIIGELFRESSAEACALYKFMKAMVVALSFFCSSQVGLHTQTAILSVSAVISLASFTFAHNASNATNTNPETKPLLTKSQEGGTGSK